MPDPRRAGSQPFLRRLREAGHDPQPFSGRATRVWLAGGAAALLLLALLPLLRPELAGATQRVAALLALAFLVAAVGAATGLGARAFPAASVLVLALYGLTAWGRLAFPVSDLVAVAFLLGLGLFALAGFNLVFILEEAVYDAHRHLHLRHPAWQAAPTVGMAAVAVLLPAWEAAGGPRLWATWVAALGGAALLAGWWLLGGAAGARASAALRELHLLTVGALLAAALADAALWLRRSSDLLPSLVAYLALLGTWFYVSYTTLQRTHFLLRRRNVLPWLCILTAASLSVLSQVQALYLSSGSPAVGDLVHRRADYLVAGVCLGLAFLVARGLARALRLAAAEAGLGPRTRTIAGAAAGAAGRLLDAEAAAQAAVGAAAQRLLRGVDRALPRRHKGWELDSQDFRVRTVPHEGEPVEPEGGGEPPKQGP